MTLDVASVLNGTGATVTVVEPNGTVSERALQVSELQAELGTVRIDSRTVEVGDLFLALPGTQADGHDFLGAAFLAGARGAMVSRLPSDEQRLPATDDGAGLDARFLFLVPDPLAGLQDLARYWRRRHAARIIGITGSIGKTTTKEIVAAVLRTKWSILKNEANLNTEIGLPLTLMGLQSEHRAAVLEMGMYVKGDIGLLADIAEPDVGIVTTVAPVHLERMGSIEAIAREKSRLVASLPADGLAILNADDPWTRAMAVSSGTAASTLVGLHPDADYRALDAEPCGLEGTSFTLEGEGRRLKVRTQVPGIHTIHAFLAATAVARSFDMSWTDVREALESVQIDIRQRILRRGEHILIIDDSYNAAPMSMHASLALLHASPGTKVAVLGDMLELGALEEQAHREVGERAAATADWLVACGLRGRWMADAALQAGMPGDRVVVAASNLHALEATERIMREPPGTAGQEPIDWAILVKGSRGMEMEEIVAGLQGGT